MALENTRINGREDATETEKSTGVGLYNTVLGHTIINGKSDHILDE